MEPADATQSIDQGAARFPLHFLKYVVQTLLFVAVCVGGFMAAYRAGVDRGYRNGRSKWRGEQYLPRAYFVGDLAGPSGSYATQDIENVITVHVEPTSWEGVGGPASLQVLVDRNRNPVFVIKQDSGPHEEIARILAELRAGTGH